MKSFGVVVLFRKTYLTYEIVLHEVHKDFDESYDELIPFLQELKVYDYEWLFV